MHTAAAADLETRRRRSSLTNNPRRLPGVDMRSPHGRRFRDIVNGLIAEFGDADVTRLRELGGLKYSLEQVQALVVPGDSRACEDLVRLSNLITRREGELRARFLAAASSSEQANSVEQYRQRKAVERAMREAANARNASAAGDAPADADDAPAAFSGRVSN